MEIKQFIDIEAFTQEVNVEIDSTNLHAALSNQTARHAYYSTQVVLARTQKDKIALDVKRLAAGLTKAVRKQLIEEAKKEVEGTKKSPERITNDMVQAEVALHPKMREWELLQIEADEVYGICKVAADAFFTRKEMLKQVGHLSVESMRQNMKFQSHQKEMDEYDRRRAARQGGGAAQG